MFGFGSSCLFVSCYVVTSLYFKKKQSIATGIIASGSGLGVFAVAPILRTLLNTFDWRKTYRIMAGIFSVVCFLCLTFDPAGVKNEEQETGQENKEIESKNFDEKDERTIEKSKRWFVDCSVFKKKMFVVLTLCTTLANLGHNTPRFHMVKTVLLFTVIVVFVSDILKINLKRTQVIFRGNDLDLSLIFWLYEKKCV